MRNKKVVLQKMGTKKAGRPKNKKTLTHKERYQKKKKALEEWKAWFK